MPEYEASSNCLARGGGMKRGYRRHIVLLPREPADGEQGGARGGGGVEG